MVMVTWINLFPTSLLIMGISLWGCADSPTAVTPPPGSDSGISCGASLKPAGAACVPDFDECLDSEIPMLRGGCKRVGVEECPGGIKGPPDWSCTPVGPPTKCLPGWALVKDGWCEPILPAGACGTGEMEIMGQATCQPMGDCGGGKYGKISVSAKTIYVDAAYAKLDSDGSLAKPFSSIAAAITAAPSGGHIAVAEGIYKVFLKIEKPLTIEGRCPQKVLVQSPVKTSFSSINILSKGVVLKGLTVVGSLQGVYLSQAEAELHDVTIRDTDGMGIVVTDSKAQLQRCLIEDNQDVGVYLDQGSTVELNSSVVRDTKPDALGRGGMGIQVCHDESKNSCNLTMTDSVVVNNHSTSITVYGSKISMARSMLKDTQPRSNKQGGAGLLAEVSKNISQGSTVEMTDCVVANNRFTGVILKSAKGTFNRTVIRDTGYELATELAGYGILAAYATNRKTPSSLVISRSALVRNTAAGISAYDTLSTITGSLIWDTRSSPTTKVHGNAIVIKNQGVSTQPPPLTLKDSILRGNLEFSLVSVGVDVDIGRTIIVDTRPEISSRDNGVGLLFHRSKDVPDYRPALTMADCLIARSRTVGVMVSGGNASIRRSIILDTMAHETKHSSGDGLRVLNSSLDVKESLLRRSTGIALYTDDTKVTLDAVVVRDTLPEPIQKIEGVGIFMRASSGPKADNSAVITNSHVINNYASGVVASNNVTIQRSVIKDTHIEVGRKAFGDGVVVFGNSASLQMENCAVERSKRAGLVLTGATGVVKSSLFKDGTFSIVLSANSTASISGDNTYQDNERDSPSFDLSLTTVNIPKPPAIDMD